MNMRNHWRGEVTRGKQFFFYKNYRVPHIYKNYRVPHHGMLPELGITCMGLQHRLEKLGTTLAAAVDTVLGPDGVGEIPMAAVHDVIREYARRGVRLTRHFGPIAELSGIKGPALDGRLKRKFKTTLAKEVRAVLGP
jgi:hypothetical protein